jgi:hypothetical protein
MNLLDATLAFMEDATDIVLKAPELDTDGIGQSMTPVPSRIHVPTTSAISPLQQTPEHTDFQAL